MASVILIVPGLAVTVRRLHDIGKSGWLMLLYLLPVVGQMVVWILCCNPSDKGSNSYGEESTFANNDQAVYEKLDPMVQYLLVPFGVVLWLGFQITTSLLSD